MRRSLGKFSDTTIGNATKLTSSFEVAAFSTSAGGGGRGRGRGGADFTNSRFAPGKAEPEPDDSKDESPFPSGLGHGRGRHPILPSLSSYMSGINSAAAACRGRGRGGGGVATPTEPVPPRPEEAQPSASSRLNLSLREDASDSIPTSTIPDRAKRPEENNLASSILSVLNGGGRGKPMKPPAADEKPKLENRHIRARQPETGPGERSALSPRLSREEAVKKAVGILSKGGEGEERGRGRGLGREVAGRGLGGRGRRMQDFGGRGGRGRGRGRGRRRGVDEDEDYGSGLYLGDNADGEKLAERIGADNMNKLVEGFEEMSDRILPSPLDDAYLDAVDTNWKIECEPEYLMEEFGTNPDIDENPPISLRDALEKVKPFLMTYEGIQSQEEWEEVIKETMEKVPIIKELVEHYSGPDRVTAKQQQEELERVAKTLPLSAPTSVKSFADRAVLSLQSNPGWGFDKKCQFMDKLVMEVSKRYK